MFDEALSGKVKLFRYLLNKNTCCTVIVTIELSVKSFLVISFFWWSEFHVKDPYFSDSVLLLEH